MISLWVFIVLIVTLYGRELMAYRARFSYDENGKYIIAPDPKLGAPPSIHFEDFGSALMTSFNIFYNEEWHITMYEMARTEQFISIIFFVFMILFG